MGDMGTIWRDQKRHSQCKRKMNREDSARILIESGINFTSNNEGAHLIVQKDSIIIDFWPGTGKYITRSGKHGRGILNLLKEVEKCDTQ